jgi:anti-sigma factor RsiW
MGDVRMSCDETLRTQALIDGELDDAAAIEAERHMFGCEDCKALGESDMRLSHAIRGDATHFDAPPGLKSKIDATLDTEARKNARSPQRSTRSFWLGAASGGAAMALAASIALFLILPPSAATLEETVFDAHTTALMSGRTIEVVSSNHHTVKPWFAGRVPLSPPVADFASEGFALAGGRVGKVADAPAAVVVYRHGAHEIDLFVWADRGSHLPVNATRLGYHASFWKEGDLNFAAVSDTDTTELAKFEKLIRGERE